MKNTIRYSLSACLAAAVLLCGCTESPADAMPSPAPGGEEVAVALTLTPEALQSPSEAAAAQYSTSAMFGATTATTAALAAQTTPQSDRGGMELRMEEEPATRAVDDNTAQNIWTFQFNGSGTGALLTNKQYRSNYTAGETFILKTGTNQRIVVLANSYDEKLADKLTYASTYADLKALIRPIARETTGGVPMSGELVADITSGTQLTIPVTRTYAKVTLCVKLGKGMTTTDWNVQAMDIAPAYWLPDLAAVTYPAADKLTGDFLTPDANQTLSTIAYTTFTYYLPANRRGEVAGTTSFQRKTNAPEGSTYIKVSRTTTNPNLLLNVNYYVHLGGNLTTDYNLRANTQYTIYATLLADTGDDSRAENRELDISDLQYAGMFGGELKARNGVYQFTKELWVQKSNASTNAAWGPEGTTGITDKVDGKGNTLALVKRGQTGYPAAWACFQKNPGLIASTTTLNTAAYQWYLPAQQQLMGVWAAHSSFAIAFAFAASGYWSSTETNSAYSWYVYFGSGSTYSSSNKTDTNTRTRCVREM